MIRLDNVSKDYVGISGNIVHLLEDISCEIKSGRINVFLAPTGSGKSSLAKIICGLEKPTKGRVILKDFKPVYIPSEPASFPWFNVTENIKWASPEIDDNEIKKICEIVGLEGYEEHFPHNKSAGFRFRISLARALAKKPYFIVLDEPFNRMDIKTAKEIYKMILEIGEQNITSFLIATTNITESVILADEIILLQKNPGKIIDRLTNGLSTDKRKNMDFDSITSQRKIIEEKFNSLTNRELFNFTV